MPKKYETVIGLEVHVEMKTASKMFCGCTTEFGGAPNSHVCPVCLGLPGTLPVLNKKAVDYAIQTALALGCRITETSRFSRKNYFYPDLAKAYQISQYDLPLAVQGSMHIRIGEASRTIRINRVHLEEDAGKLVHIGTISTSPFSMVDYNRSGVPLMEIVSEPDIRTSEEAKAYLEKLKSILRFIGVSDCKMEEGSLRCDANISIMEPGATEFGTKVEIKNLNSFRSVARSIDYETARQADLLEKGERIVQETRTWDEGQEITLSMRSKEEAHDYRYFPEPDLVPIVTSEEWVAEQRSLLPELPDARKERYMQQFNLGRYDAELLTAEPEVGVYYDAVMGLYDNSKAAANWINGDLMYHLNEQGIEFENNPLSAEQLVSMLKLIDQGVISGKIAKTVFAEMFNSGKNADEVVAEKGLVQISDGDVLAEIVADVIAANSKTVEDFLNGKAQASGYLVGQVMKATKGKANPNLVNEILQKQLASLSEKKS